MSEQIKASAQYNDMQGTIAIDGWDGLSALSVGAGGRKGYVTVGLSIYGEPDTRGGKLEPIVCIWAVDESILDGEGPDAVRRYAKQYGELPVFRFESKLNLVDVLPQLKRLSIELQDKCTERVPLRIAGADKIYGEDNDNDEPEDDIYFDDNESDDE